jgi:flagellar biosynthesis protein FlhF
MLVKKYRARNMPEAMGLVRADLGPDAVILHTQKVNGALSRILGTPSLEVTAAVDRDLRDFPRPTPAARDSIQSLQRELAAVKVALAQVADARQGRSPASANLDGWYQRLLNLGVSTSLAQQIVQSVAEELNQWVIDSQPVLDQHLHWQLARRLPARQVPRLGESKSLVVFIVGPTGVGKTTTIAKLAANYRALCEASVLMITTDTFRVAALPQIATYGEVFGIPVEVAHTPQQLAAQVEVNRPYHDLILVDTPGRSQRASDKVAELYGYLDAVEEKVVYLALTATAKLEDMQRAVEVFGQRPLDGLILTKLDETVSLGAAYSLTCHTGLPYAYFTTGQQVPQDIELASVERMVQLMINGPCN